jgi:hypothetical protein
MSRYIAQCDEKYTITIGWDDPLETFFCTIEDNTLDEDDENAVNYFIGGIGNHEQDIAKFEERIKEFVPDLGDGLRSCLINDYNNRREPSPLQHLMRSLFEDEE